MTRSERRDKERFMDKHYGVPKSQKIETKNTFGCEVSNDYISKNHMELLRKIGLRNIIKVKRRKNGKTSSMKSGGCHRNVRILVELCGGKQILGYTIHKERGDKIPFQIQYHSVWITPEGEVIDPTKDLDDPTNEKEYTYFSPVYIYQDDGFWIDGENLLLPDDLVKKGFYICERDFGGGEISPYGFGYVFPLTELSWRNTLHSNLFQSKEERLEKTNEHLHDELGGFTEPSSYNKTNKVVGMSQSLTNPQI